MKRRTVKAFTYLSLIVVLSVLASGCTLFGIGKGVEQGEGTVNIKISIPDDYDSGKLLVSLLDGTEHSQEVAVDDDVVSIQFTGVHSGPWEIIVKSEDDLWTGYELISVVPNKTITVNLNLTRATTYVLDTNVEGEGSIEVDPDRAEYVENTRVTLRAVPADGWEFVGWQGDAEGTESTITITMNSNKEVTAVFNKAIIMVHQQAEYDPEPWSVSTNPTYLPQTYGDSYAYSTKKDSWAKWTPEIPEEGEYGIYLWWSAHTTRDGLAIVEIKHADGVDTVRINQKANGGQWNYIGTYKLSAGTDNYVRLSSSGNGQAIADAIRFVEAKYVTETDPVIVEYTEPDSDQSSITAVDNGDGSVTFELILRDANGQPITGLGMQDIYLEWIPNGARHLVTLDSGPEFNSNGSWHVPADEFSEPTPGTYRWILVRNPAKLPHTYTNGVACTVMGIVIDDNITTADGVFKIDATDHHYLDK